MDSRPPGMPFAKDGGVALKWLKRMVLSVEDKWPLRPPPTVPPYGPPDFHCPHCKAPTDADAATCAACGADLRYQE